MIGLVVETVEKFNLLTPVTHTTLRNPLFTEGLLSI